jgi:NMD protein affecting ribosome stability and mRNA decay
MILCPNCKKPLDEKHLSSFIQLKSKVEYTHCPKCETVFKANQLIVLSGKEELKEAVSQVFHDVLTNLSDVQSSKNRPLVLRNKFQPLLDILEKDDEK